MISEEILRYSGIKKDSITEEISSMISAAIKETEGLRPKCVFKEISDVEIFKSEDLKNHLSGCERFFLFAATLGTDADRILKRYTKTDIAKASVIQAVLAAEIEEYADKMMNEFDSNGLYFRPRFSPGYGDFNISHQKTILTLLDAGKLLGITLTDSYMMIPEKSITAVLGLSKEKSCIINKCAECKNKGCQYRKEVI